jgi:hypothetical protein
MKERTAMTTITTDTLRQLNHVEMVYRPGERELAARVFELLGLRVIDHGGEWFFSLVDPAVADVANNACYASQVTAEQWALEQALATTIEAADDAGTGDAAVVGSAARAYLDRLRAEPQRSFHFGIRYYERADFDATLDRIRAADDDPELAGRVALSGVYHPDEPGALAPNMIQAFVRTDVVSAGLLAFGQHVELQWHLPRGRAARS